MSTQKEIDFSPLLPKTILSKLTISDIALFIGVCFLIGFVQNPDMIPKFIPHRTLIAWVFTITTFVVISYKTYLTRNDLKVSAQKQGAVVGEFALVNGWKSVSNQITKDVENTIAPVLRGATTTLDKEGITINGVYNGTQFTLATYSRIFSDGSDSYTKDFSCFSFRSSKKYPHIVIDNKKNDYLGLLPNNIDGGTRMKLEGDFDSYYGLTVVPGTERSVLEIITPDFMSELINAQSLEDFEIEGNNVFVISADNWSEDIELAKRLFKDIDVFIHHLNQVEKHWQASATTKEVAAISEQILNTKFTVTKPGRAATVFGIFVFAVIGIAMIVTFMIFVIYVFSSSSNIK